MLAESVSQQIINAVSDCVFKKMFNGEIIINLKRILEWLCYYK